jgi:hypothetical protein
VIKQPVTLPNFFILGAGRSGTTSLALALTAHPDVFIPSIKEPSFFSSSFQWVKEPAKYVSIYEAAHDVAAVGDASHIYLEDPASPRILQAFFPDARFVLVFRDPVDRAVGLYAHMVERGYETHGTFERALAAEDRRFQSQRFRRGCAQSFWNYMYVRSGLFGEQIQRYYEHFDRDRFWFTTLDELITRPTPTMRSLHQFLGIAPMDVDAFPRDGTSKGTRSIALQYTDRRLLRPLGRRTGTALEPLRRNVNRWNRLSAKPTMRPETRVQLQERFEPDLRLLRELTGVDLVETRARSTTS